MPYAGNLMLVKDCWRTAATHSCGSPSVCSFGCINEIHSTKIESSTILYDSSFKTPSLQWYFTNIKTTKDQDRSSRTNSATFLNKLWNGYAQILYPQVGSTCTNRRAISLLPKSNRQVVNTVLVTSPDAHSSLHSNAEVCIDSDQMVILLDIHWRMKSGSKWFESSANTLMSDRRMKVHINLQPRRMMLCRILLYFSSKRLFVYHRKMKLANFIYST